MRTIVIGSLSTDLVATGIKQFPKPGEYVYGKELCINPGGISRNVADMIAHLAPIDSVAMVGRTVRDPYGLWKVPMDALAKAGVNTEYVTVLDYTEGQKLPGIVLIPVDEQGNNQIFILHGSNDDFSIGDIDNAASLFEEVGKNEGTLIVTLECPLETAIHAIALAHKCGLKVMLDPGGIRPNANVGTLFQAGIYFIKSNRYETKILTGIDVTDFENAERAAGKLREQGIENVLLTVGAGGAYLFTENEQMHLAIPEVTGDGEKDETGCGDQTIAALATCIQDGKPLKEAAELAVRAGTLQFHKSGVQPLTTDELFGKA